MGAANRIPYNPKYLGKIITAGIKMISCRVEVRNVEILAFPTA